MTKVFSLSKFRVILYAVSVFCISAALAFWGLILSIGRIWKISPYEIVGIFTVSFGVTALYLLLYTLFAPRGQVCVSGEGVEIRKGKKVFRCVYAEIFGVRFGIGLLHRLLKTVKIMMETRNKMVKFYLSPVDARNFLSMLPSFSPNSKKEDCVCISSGKEKYFAFLTDFIHLFLLGGIFFLTVFPTVIVFLGSVSRAGYFAMTYGIILGAMYLLSVFRRIFRGVCFSDHQVKMDERGIRVRYGAAVRNEYFLPYENIACFEICQSAIEKLLGYSRIKVVTDQAVDGVSDAECFPFLLSERKVKEIAYKLQPGLEYSKGPTNAGFRAVVPYLQYILIPAIIVFCLSFILNFALLAIEIDFLIFTFFLYKNKGISLRSEYMDLSCGVLYQRRVILRYERVLQVVGKANPVAKGMGRTLLEVSVGKLSPAYFAGYIKKEDFSKIIEMIPKKVDKEN